MFCRCFGNYLLGKNIITQDQLDLILEYQRANRVKLGLIAVEQKLLTVAKAEEINRLQMIMDKRFGDIAVERGYLKEEDLMNLLKLQGNPYLLFVQAVTENQILSKEKVDVCLVAFSKEYGYSPTELEALKNGEIEKIVSLLTKVEAPQEEIIALFIKNLVRFANSDIVFGAIKKSNHVRVSHLAMQEISGEIPMILALGCQEDELLTIAEPFGKENFSSLDEDALDAVCEFINITNGLYASKLSHDDIELELLPPQIKHGVTLSSTQELLELDIYIAGKMITLILAYNQAWEII